MSINVSIGYGTSHVSVIPEAISVRKQNDELVIAADDASCSETVSIFLTRQHAKTLLATLQSLLGKST